MAVFCHTVLSVVLICALTPAFSLASDPEDSSNWPHVRGPNYDGVATDKDLADSWPSQGPPVLWTRELGQGYSSFAVVNGKAYTQYQTLSGQYVICLDVSTGATLWEHRYDWPWQPASVYPGPYATPTWDKGKVYFAAPSGLVGCVDAATGQPRWSVNVVKQFHGRGAEFGYACSPLLEDGMVILPVGGTGASVVALNADDGSLKWKSGEDPASYCPAYPITLQGQRQILAFLRNSLAGFDPKTGRVIWRHELSNDYDEHSAWPLFAEPFLIVCSPFRCGAQAFSMTTSGQVGSLMPKPIWASRELSNDIFSSVVYEGHIYGFDITDFQAKSHRPSRGQFKCLDLKTGKVKWSTDRTGQATVLVADGKLILFNDSGTLILARACSDAYEELGRVRVLADGLCWTQPALWHGRLLVRNQSRAACLYLGRPELLTAEEQQGALVVADIPHRFWFDWTSIIGYEREYPFDAPAKQELVLWYTWGVVGLAGAGLAALGVVGVTRLFGAGRFQRARPMLFEFAAFLIGLIGTPLFSRIQDTLVFTLPLVCSPCFNSLSWLWFVVGLGRTSEGLGGIRGWRSWLSSARVSATMSFARESAW
jgi:outer membrane protein assembly factor BamB